MYLKLERFSMLDEKLFNEKGYIIIENVLTDKEVSYYKNVCYSDVFSKHLKQEVSGFNFHLLEILAMEKKLISLAKHPAIVELIKPILGKNIQLQHSKLATKMPGKNLGNVAWHQDFAFSPHTNTDLVAVMIALDAINEINGCMKMLSGSYKRGPLNHNDSMGNIVDKCMDPVWKEEGAVIENVIVPRGGISIHHCLNLHCSYDNLSDQPRTAMVFEYRADDAMQLADGVWKDTGMMVSGVRQNKVRCEELTANLPKSERYGEDHPFGHAWNQVGDIEYLKLCA
jgi:phytanoyl-CoA hydroxylase